MADNDDKDNGVGVVDLAGGAAASVVGTGAAAVGYGHIANRNVSKTKGEYVSAAFKKAEDAIDGKHIEGEKPVEGIRLKYNNSKLNLFNDPKVLSEAEQELFDTHTAELAVTSDSFILEATNALKKASVTEGIAPETKTALNALIDKLKPAYNLEKQLTNAESELKQATSFAEKFVKTKWYKPWEQAMETFEHTSGKTKLALATAVPVVVALGGTYLMNQWRNSGKPDLASEPQLQQGA